MDLNLLMPLVEQIRGCTFASLDALCEPKRGVMQRIIGENVLIFRTDGKSGYEGMVKRRLAEAGKDPDSFSVGPLPWGTRLGNLPIIEHNGKHYLQTILISRGKEEYFLPFTNTIIEPSAFGIKPRFPANQGLPESSAVIVHTYNINNIERITLKGETLEDTATYSRPNRAILKIKT